MTFPIYFPDKKGMDNFKKLLKEAKELSGASYHRIVITALTYYILKIRKGQY